MSVPIFEFPFADDFAGRVDQLSALETWWQKPTAEPINMFGRRRVGKSWLFRKFAHGKKAILLVAASTTLTDQLSKFADRLAPFLGGVVPNIKDIGTLFQILYGLGEKEKLLVVIDEFPYLLGFNKKEIFKSLSLVQAAMEQNKDTSRVKIILCGSAQAQMESMQEMASPLYDRLRRFEVAPLTFQESKGFFSGTDLTDHLTRYAIAGGMPKYLASIGKGDLASVIASEVVSVNSVLFDQVEQSLDSELRESRTYFSILEQLAVRPMSSSEIGSAIGKPSGYLAPYLNKLQVIRVISSKTPVGAEDDSRTTKWECLDGYIRFYFRFVFPYKENLDAGGADPTQHVAEHIMPFLSEHTSLEFEKVFRRWVNQNYPQASLVGNWWGKSLPGMQHDIEEIDLLGIKGSKIILAAEAKWQVDKLKLSVYTRLVQDKIPAVEATGMKRPNQMKIILASKGGFTPDVIILAKSDSNVRLVDATEILRDVV